MVNEEKGGVGSPVLAALGPNGPESGPVFTEWNLDWNLLEWLAIYNCAPTQRNIMQMCRRRLQKKLATDLPTFARGARPTPHLRG